MSELIKALVSIKDPFTLFAFVAVVLLIAFRTRTVPESVFKLFSQKITRQRFYQLLNRSLLYAFGVFLVLCAIAVVGQVLDYKTTARAASLEDLKAELEATKADRAAAEQAIANYQKSVLLAENERLGDAIASLEASIRAVPTATARETLALLYQEAGDQPRAIQVAEEAVAAARGSGRAVSTARAERLLATLSTPTGSRASHPCPPDAGLVGAKLDLPAGGDTFENAPLIAPCVYRGILDVDKDWRYYRVSVPGGKTLRVVMRTRDSGAAMTQVRLHGPNGANLGGYYAFGDSSITKPIEYKADSSATAYISVQGGVRGSALDVAIR